MENDQMQMMPMPIYIPTGGGGGGGASGSSFDKAELDEAARKFSKKPALQKAFKKGARWAENQTPEEPGFGAVFAILGMIAVLIFVAFSVLTGVERGYDRFSGCSPQTALQKYNLIYRGSCHVGAFLGSKP